ncbi:MAG: hypothetical protein JSV13_02180 [Nitrospiraceae bacterium]|jgi:hypothetical protein|nr:MAG: hypothetical protein JSV13_02180 [Nitrospiraceae bacterium]
MMVSHNRIKQFVRITLGCVCPKEVFRQILCQHSPALTDALCLTQKIDVGGRLLIYVFAADTAICAVNALPELVSIGKDERDSNGYKRLRIVIATPDPETVGPIAEGTFRKLGSIDEKVHLHIIHSDELHF